MLPLHPYVLGIMLGDGSFGYADGYGASGTNSLTCFDPEIVDRARRLLEGSDFKFFDTRVDGQYRLGDLSRYGRATRQTIKDLRLLGTKSDTKFIPRAYLDAAAVPYIVIPSHWRKAAKGVVMGCRATIEDTKTGKVLECVMGELGPRAKTGEASIFAAQYFGVPASPKNGGTDARRFEYTFYPGAKSVVDVPLIPA